MQSEKVEHYGSVTLPPTTIAAICRYLPWRAPACLNAVDERAQSRGRVRLAAVAAALPEPAATELGNQL